MFQYNNGYEEYANVNTLFDRFTINKENLNTEIEIIEEDKKIKKLDEYEYDTANEILIIRKINEIIDYLDKGE